MNYIHEAGSFVPLVQVHQASAMTLDETTDAKALMEASGRVYDIERDPLWNGVQRNVPRAFDRQALRAIAVPVRLPAVAVSESMHNALVVQSVPTLAPLSGIAPLNNSAALHGIKDVFPAPPPLKLDDFGS